jgi:hypothetical protein
MQERGNPEYSANHLDVPRRKHRPFGEPITGSLGRERANKEQTTKEKSEPTALPDLILQIIPDRITKRLLVTLVNQVD